MAFRPTDRLLLGCRLGFLLSCRLGHFTRLPPRALTHVVHFSRLGTLGTGARGTIVRSLPTTTMTFARFSLSLVGVVGIIAVALAGATIWLLITQPVTVADAVAQGEVSPLARALAGAIYDALQGILKYL